MILLSLSTSLIVGVGLVAAMVATALLRRKVPEMKHGIAIFLMGPGTFGGLRVFWRCVDASDQRLGLETDEKIYIVVGAICLVWISLHEGIRAIKAMQA